MKKNTLKRFMASAMTAVMCVSSLGTLAVNAAPADPAAARDFYAAWSYGKFYASWNWKQCRENTCMGWSGCSCSTYCDWSHTYHKYFENF